MSDPTPGRSLDIVTVAIRYENDVVLARQRARRIAELVGFDRQDQIRFATTVSELARNAFQYAREGRVRFSVEAWDRASMLVAEVRDSGPGIADPQAIVEGRYVSRTGMGVGLLGARRLNDRFELRSASGTGTTVTIGRIIPGGRIVESAELAHVTGELERGQAGTPFEELQQQNQELMSALDQLRQSKADIERLNIELEETNRGVVALYGELDDRAKEMRRLSDTKTRFLSDMSHELRTPLTSMINLARLLLDRTDGELSEEQDRQVSLISRSAESLVEMVSDLLDIAKIEAGRVDLHPEQFSVGELFAGLRGMFRPLSIVPAGALIFEEDHHDLLLHTDERRVAQVLRNFISNALKFTSEGEVRVKTEPGGDMVSITVSDTGAGIAEADQERVFEEFVQVDGPIQRRLRGTGLGLPVSRKLAALLGGEITVQSQLGTGSAFTLRIPLRLEAVSANG